MRHRLRATIAAAVLLAAAGIVPSAHATAPQPPAQCANTTTVYPLDGPAVEIPSGPATVTQTFTVADSGTAIADVDLMMAIRHSFSGDLDITLTSPAGTEVTITTDNGSSADDAFDGTVWDDDAGDTNPPGPVTDMTFVNGVAFPTLVPEGAMAAFIGEDPNGTWTLTVTDDTAVDGGFLDGAELRITTRAGAQTTTTATVPGTGGLSIPDASTATSDAVVNGFGPHLAKLVVRTDIRHTFSADLDVTLTSPEGTHVTLTTDNGAGNDDVFAGTTWDDAAVERVVDRTYANNVVAEWVVPEEAMGAFIGEDPNGTWTLTVTDDLANDTGTLVAWSVEITTAECAPPPVVTATASPDVEIDAAPLTGQATVAGLGGTLGPTATVDFALYGPDDDTCAGPAVFTASVPYPTAGATVTSPPFVPTVVGTYRWIAAFPADIDNVAATSACGDAGTTTVVAPKPEVPDDTGLLPPGDPSPIVTPVVEVPASVVPPNPSPAACARRGFELIGIQDSGTTARPAVRLVGVADRSLAGRTIRVQRDGRDVASATVAADGTIQATLAAPRNARSRAIARYRLTLGERRTRALKATRFARVADDRAATGGERSVSGTFTGLRGRRDLRVQAIPFCGPGKATDRTIRSDAQGRFRLTLTAPTSGVAMVYRIHDGKRTVTLPLVVTAGTAGPTVTR